MQYFNSFYLDNEKDIIVNLYRDKEDIRYVLETPNHHTGNLITNLAKICELPITYNEEGLKIIEGTIPCYIDSNNKEVFIFRLGNTKVANIYPSGIVEMKASIPSISKTLMSQTKDYSLDLAKTVIKSFILKDQKFRTDLHTHMNANLNADVLIALGIAHQIRYPLYYINKLELQITDSQRTLLEKQREIVALRFADSPLEGKNRERRINDNVFINFADLILNNIDNAKENIQKIRASLTILKDGQAVFTNLEKTYLYRYVFCKGVPYDTKISLRNVNQIPDTDIIRYVRQMLLDKESAAYGNNTLFQDKLLWIARMYQSQGIEYVEISDTTLVKKQESIRMLQEVHEVMPAIQRETGVHIRFLAAIRRIPLTIIKDALTPATYLKDNLSVLRAVCLDPYVVGSDFVGEEINDISEMKPVIEELVKIAKDDPGFTIRIHAGENNGLKDNVSTAVKLVKDALQKGQSFPHVRIGHGLYTASLRSQKGKQLLQQLKENNVVLEFQITSNVRLNNLNSLQTHPIRQYLNEQILCVQGTDGAALYGTTCIDEQLSLEKLLELTADDMRKIKETEQTIIQESLENFFRKQEYFRQLTANQSMEDVFTSIMEQAYLETKEFVLPVKRTVVAADVLSGKVKELPWDKFPIILAGGSFNVTSRPTKVTKADTDVIDALLHTLDPDKVFFVVGHKVTGYEKYLIDHNTGFEIFSYVPAMLTRNEAENLQASSISIRIGITADELGTYKSFNYEIFERRPSVLLAFDGNAAGENLIQEAKNGKGKSYIFVARRSSSLRKKAQSLQGYVHLFDQPEQLSNELTTIINNTKG
ncbi:MAG: adenosine deaminase [Erysipelotrichaceae bacterium]|nr:adenosine deaminase [Erysipelotrichaceae bacterium]